jgi:hypothetical protein
MSDRHDYRNHQDEFATFVVAATFGVADLLSFGIVSTPSNLTRLSKGGSFF